MAYSPFDVSSLPELGGVDSINLEEELKKISEKITGLEDVELNGPKGSADRHDTITHSESTDSNDAILELSLDSIIERVRSEHEHITIEHADDGSPAAMQQSKKRVRSEALTPLGEELDVDGVNDEERTGKRRRIDLPAGSPVETTDGTSGGASREVVGAPDGVQQATSQVAILALGGGTPPTLAGVTVEEEHELSWSWGDDEATEMETNSIVPDDPPKKSSALLAEIVAVEDVELREEEEKLAKELNGSLSRENPFELPIIIRQRRVARLRRRSEAHQHKIKQILTNWDVTSLKRS